MTKPITDKWILLDRLGVRLTKLIEMSENCLKIQDEALRAKDIVNELKMGMMRGDKK